MHRYGIIQPIWQHIGSRTLTKPTKLGVIPLAESQQLFWTQPLWNTNDNMGFNQFWMLVTFQFRGLHHLHINCTLIIEEGLKSNIHFDCRYLELWNACIISLDFIALNVRDGTESKYPSIVFLGIFTIETWRVSIADSCTFYLNVTCRNAADWPRASFPLKHGSRVLHCHLSPLKDIVCELRYRR